MNTIQHVYISGLGAVGSAYAGKLFEMDPECVRVIADQTRRQQYIQKGITINGKPVPFQYIQPGEPSAPADLILLAVKHHHLPQAIKDIRSFVGPDTILLSLLNGISSEEVLGAEFGMDKMLYAFCVGIDAVREDTGTTYSKLGKIVFGEKRNEFITPRVAAVEELFQKAGIPYTIPPDMIREQWWKFMLNVGINQVSAILKAPYGVFHTVPEARELMLMASREVIRLAEKLGINLAEEDINEYLRIIGTLSPEGKTSMLQDMEVGRKTEVEIFSGTVIELGKSTGVPTPVNEILYKMIRALEQMQPGRTV